MPKEKQPVERQCPEVLDSALSPHFLCLHMGDTVPFLLQLPWQREMFLPDACSGQGQQDRLEPGDAWDVQGCSSQAKTFPWAGSAVAKPLSCGCGPCLEMAELARMGSAGSASSPELLQSFSCTQEHLFLREALGGRGISDHKLQTPWLS